MTPPCNLTDSTIYRETARHTARFYALRAARCADGSRPIPTNIPETDFIYKLTFSHREKAFSANQNGSLMQSIRLPFLVKKVSFLVVM